MNCVCMKRCVFLFKTLVLREEAKHRLQGATLSTGVLGAPKERPLFSFFVAGTSGRMVRSLKRLGCGKFGLPEPMTRMFLFHSFSTIIGVGVGAGAYILSRYAVRRGVEAPHSRQTTVGMVHIPEFQHFGRK